MIFFQFFLWEQRHVFLRLVSQFYMVPFLMSPDPGSWT